MQPPDSPILPCSPSWKGLNPPRLKLVVPLHPSGGNNWIQVAAEWSYLVGESMNCFVPR